MARKIKKNTPGDSLGQIYSPWESDSSHLLALRIHEYLRRVTTVTSASGSGDFVTIVNSVHVVRPWRCSYYTSPGFPGRRTSHSTPVLGAWELSVTGTPLHVVRTEFFSG